MARLIVTIGDSIAWGQGLAHEQKYSTLAARHVATLGAGSAFGSVLAAHSGAPIGLTRSVDVVDVDGEVPVDWPTVSAQVGLAASAVGSAGDVGLVLANGGINDIGVSNLLLMHRTPLVEKTQLFCLEHMRTVVRRCLDTFGNAPVILTGYYPIISRASDVAFLPILASVVGLVLHNIPGALVGGVLSIPLRDQLIASCQLFADTANRCYRDLAASETARLARAGDSRKVLVAVPHFRAEHAVFAPRSYLWGVQQAPDLLDPLRPEDAVIPQRVTACHTAWQAGIVTDFLRCRLASLGHPNASGAMAYARVIEACVSTLVASGWRPWVPGRSPVEDLLL